MGAIATSHESVKMLLSALELDIVLGRLYPRERLVEEHLAERFSVSRHIVRLALAELEATGLVLRSAGRGVVVAEYSADEVRELYEIRAQLESDAARRIKLPVEPEALERVGAVLAEWNEASLTGDLATVVRTNALFHQEIYALCGNRFLTICIDSLAQRSHIVRFSGLTDTAFLSRVREEHRQIFDALQANDSEHLAKLCVDHIMPSARSYIEMRQQRELVMTSR